MTTSQAPARSAVYRRQPDARVRPLPEWAGALVYTPHAPNLCYINTTAWAVLELCEGKTPQELEAAFIDFTSDEVSADEARTRLAEALTLLTGQQIIVAP
jgi:hypothetical protein